MASMKKARGTTPAGRRSHTDAEFGAGIGAFLRRLAGIFVMLILTVHPLIIGKDSYYGLEKVKLYFFWSVATCFLVITGVILLIRRWLDPGYMRFWGFPTLFSSLRPYEWAGLLFFLALIVSTILSDNPETALRGATDRNEGLFTWSLYIFSALAVGRFYKPKERDFLFFISAAALVAGYGICQFYGLDFLSLEIPEYSSSGPYMTFVSTMSNNNVASAYFGLAASASLVLFSRMEKRSHIIFLPLGGIIFYMMILGGARSGYVGLAAAFTLSLPFIAGNKKSAARLLWGFAAFAVLWRIAQAVFDYKATTLGWSQDYQHLGFTRPFLLPAAGIIAAVGAALWFVKSLPEGDFPKKPYRAGWLLLTAAVVAAGVISVPILAEKTGDGNLTQLSEMIKGNFDDSFASNRVFIWRRGLALWREKPITGHGPDNFALGFRERFGDETNAFMGVTVDKAHNEYLQVLVDAGILGLLGQLLFYFLIFWGIRGRQKDRLSAAAAVAMVFYMTQAFFNFSSLFANPVAWTMWGVLGSCYSRVKSPK